MLSIKLYKGVSVMHIQRSINSLKDIFLLIALLLLFIFNASNVFADFYVIAGSKGVGTKINALPYTIASPGFYYIDRDLTCATGSHGITITADNVTLDLMGFSLVGPGSKYEFDGIYMNERSNVKILNGTIRNFGRSGIYEESVTAIGHMIIDLRVKDNQSYGIKLYGKSHLVERCAVLNNGGTGIYVWEGCTVAGNACYDNNDYGIYVQKGGTIIGNNCYDNGNFGIALFEQSLVVQNTAYNNTTANIGACATCTFSTNHAP
jgi:hypothetical protein